MELINKRINRFTFNELLLVISISFNSESDKIIGLCEAKYKECNKENLIKVLESSLEYSEELENLANVIDILHMFCHAKTWIQYELQNYNSKYLFEFENNYDLDIIHDAIVDRYKQLSKKVNVFLFFLADRIFVKIDLEKKQYFFQFLQKNRLLLVKKPILNQSLEIVVESFSFKEYKCVKEVQLRGEQLHTLYSSHKYEFFDNEGEVFSNSRRVSSNITRSRKLCDFQFIEEKIPNSMKNLNIVIDNAIMENVEYIPHLNNHRLNAKIKFKTKNLKESLKQSLIHGICLNGQLPQFIRTHFSKCSINNINLDFE